VLPVKLREKLGDVVFVTKGIEEYLALYSKDAWNDLQEKIKGVSYFSLSSQARNALRIMMDAEDINIDGAGRILLSGELREYAHLSQDVKFIKLPGHVEIWDKQLWKERENSTLENLSKLRKERESSTLENLSELEKELKELGI
jgi:MraZ protein